MPWFRPRRWESLFKCLGTPLPARQSPEPAGNVGIHGRVHVENSAGLEVSSGTSI